MIVVDAYRQPYIPFYLATREFFDLVAEKLAPGGVVIVNVGHPEGNDDLETAIGRTMAASFPTVLRDPVEDSNTLLARNPGRGEPGPVAGGDRPASPRTFATWRPWPPRGSARGCPAARSTPTTGRRSSG